MIFILHLNEYVVLFFLTNTTQYILSGGIESMGDGNI